MGGIYCPPINARMNDRSVILAALIDDAAGGLAGRLTGGLAFAAAALAACEVAGGEGANAPRGVFADLLTTPQEVLQADWQEVWHSPQPPSASVMLRVFRVTMCFISKVLQVMLYLDNNYLYHKQWMSSSHFCPECKCFPALYRRNFSDGCDFAVLSEQ
jgi:hypothetical protein